MYSMSPSQVNGFSENFENLEVPFYSKHAAWSEKSLFDLQLETACSGGFLCFLALELRYLLLNFDKTTGGFIALWWNCWVKLFGNILTSLIEEAGYTSPFAPIFGIFE
jgi:hypothetical protein